MALLFCDGFDKYSVTADLLKKWLFNGGWTWTSGAGRFGGGAVQITNPGSTESLVANVSSPELSGFGCGASIKFSAIPSGNSNAFNASLFGLNGTSYNSTMIAVAGTGSPNPGCIQVYDNNDDVLFSGGPNICDGNYHWIEVERLANSGSSVLKVWVDSALLYSGTPNLGNIGSALTAVYLMSPSLGGSWTMSVDDFIFWDNTGTTNNTFPFLAGASPVRINTLSPAGAGGSTQWTPSSGANYAAVNGNYAGTTYVSDGTSGHLDLYTYGTLPFTPASIAAVVLNQFAQQQVGAATSGMIPTIKSSTTSATGATITLGSTTPVTYQSMFPVDPNTTSAWAAAGVNAMQAGQQVQ